MTTTTAPEDFLRVLDLTAAHFEQVLNLAAKMKNDPTGWRDAFPGLNLACFFEKPSTRTRLSFAAAAYRLGMLPIMLRPDELQLGRGEPLADTARVFAGYSAAIVVRTFAQRTLEELAEAADVAVVNALSDEHHPCQALADLFTLRERFGRLRGLRLAYVGDSNNVAHSLMEAGALMGMHVVVASPPGYRPHPDVEAEARRIAEEQGGTITVVTDPREAAAGADAIYTDVWVSMGQEAEAAERRRDLAPYQVNADLMALAKPHAVFMHCLPAHRGQEVTADVIDGPQSVVWQQALNRLPTEQALLDLLLAGDWVE